jgi:hypothetical protein
MSTGTIILLLVWYGWWKPRQSREKTGNRRFAKAQTPVKLVVALSVLLAVVGGSEARWQYLQFSASSALKEVTGNPDATLQCQRLSESWIDLDSASIGGKVNGRDVNTAHLKYDQCAELFSWMQSLHKAEPSPAQITAVHVLTHEGIHTTGEFNEAVTECTAIQRDTMMTEALGGSTETGLFLQKSYFETMYSRMPSAYVLGGCTIDPKFDSLLASGKAG